MLRPFKGSFFIFMNEQKLSVAIQGGFGAFHEIAAKNFFGKIPISIVPCDTFSDLFNLLADQKADCGIVAIENSVAGGILQNYSFIRDSGLTIIGEQYLRVVQNLISLPGKKIEDIKEIYSHPVAIQQCHLFLNELRRKGVKIIDSIDTALSVKMIRDEKMESAAAIASDLAARMYKMEIITEGVETNKRNFTRFQIITENKSVIDLFNKQKRKINKASLCFSLPHQSGKLSQVLSVLSFYDMNLSKIQSLPIVGVEWEYLFYIDLLFDNYERYKQSLDAIRPLTVNLQILGEYHNGRQPAED